MTSDLEFRQCSAIKSNGTRCKRVARFGFNYCYAHRFYKPAASKEIELGSEILGLSDEELNSGFWKCAECGRYGLKNTEVFVDRFRIIQEK